MFSQYLGVKGVWNVFICIIQDSVSSFMLLWKEVCERLTVTRLSCRCFLLFRVLLFLLSPWVLSMRSRADVTCFCPLTFFKIWFIAQGFSLTSSPIAYCPLSYLLAKLCKHTKSVMKSSQWKQSNSSTPHLSDFLNLGAAFADEGAALTGWDDQPQGDWRFAGHCAVGDQGCQILGERHKEGGKVIKVFPDMWLHRSVRRRKHNKCCFAPLCRLVSW